MLCFDEAFFLGIKYIFTVRQKMEKMRAVLIENQAPADFFFFEGPGGKCFWLCRPDGLSRLLSAAFVKRAADSMEIDGRQ